MFRTSRQGLGSLNVSVVVELLLYYSYTWQVFIALGGSYRGFKVFRLCISTMGRRIAIIIEPN